MRSPCFLERTWRDCWVRRPTWCKLPIKGSLGGDGGKFEFWDFCPIIIIIIMTEIKKQIKAKGSILLS